MTRLQGNRLGGRGRLPRHRLNLNENGPLLWASVTLMPTIDTVEKLPGRRMPGSEEDAGWELAQPLSMTHCNSARTESFATDHVDNT